jgi:hypothetical protein
MSRSVIRLPVLAVMLGLTPSALAAQGSFEGILHYSMSAQGQNVEPVFYVKGGKTRVEMNMGGGQAAVMLLDAESGKSMVLMPAQKMYMAMDFGAMMQGQPRPEPKAADVKFEATGHTETVAGITCEHYLATDQKEGTEADMCLAKGMGFFMGMSAPPGRGGPMGGMGGMGGGMGANLPPAAQEAAKSLKDGAFLLKMELKRGGKVEATMVATRVERKPLDSALFSPPSDYHEMKMPG